MFEKFNNWYSRQPQWLTNNVPADKILHFIAGGVVALLGYVVGYDGFVLAVIAGILKEAYDFIQNAIAERRGLPHPHNVDFSDCVWTMGGGAVIWFLLTVLSMIF